MDAKQFKHEAWHYHALPVIAMIVLLWVFVLAQKLTGNNQVGLFSALTAGAVAMWRWKLSATGCNPGAVLSADSVCDAAYLGVPTKEVPELR